MNNPDNFRIVKCSIWALSKNEYTKLSHMIQQVKELTWAFHEKSGPQDLRAASAVIYAVSTVSFLVFHLPEKK